MGYVQYRCSRLIVVISIGCALFTTACSKATIGHVISVRSKEINGHQDKEAVSKVVHASDKHGRTYLHYYVAYGRNNNEDNIIGNIVSYLMELGCAYTALDKSGISPLLIAIGCCDLHMVELLLDKKFPMNWGESLKSNVNKQGRAGITPLGLAVWCANGVIINFILQFYQKIKQHEKNFSFQVGIGEVDDRIVKVLLGAGADPSIQDGSGQTALHRLARGVPSVMLLDMLLKYGADPLKKDFKGYTPLDVAVKQVRIKSSRQNQKDQEECNNQIVKAILIMLSEAVWKLKGGEPKNCSSGICICRMCIYRAIKSAYRCAKKEHLQDSWEMEMVLRFKYYGIPSGLAFQLGGKKRSLDADENFIHINTKRKKNQEGDGSSGKSHGT